MFTKKRGDDMGRSWWDDVVAGAFGKNTQGNEKDGIEVGLVLATDVAQKEPDSSPTVVGEGVTSVSEPIAISSQDVGAGELFTNKAATALADSMANTPRGAYGRPQVKHPSQVDVTGSESIGDVFAKYQDMFDSYSAKVKAKSTGVFTKRAHYSAKEYASDSPQVLEFLANNPDYVKNTGKNMAWIKQANGDIHVLKLAEDKSSSLKATSNFFKTINHDVSKGRWLSAEKEAKELADSLTKFEERYGKERSERQNQQRYVLLEQKQKYAANLKEQFAKDEADGKFTLADNSSPYSFTNTAMQMLEKDLLPLATEYVLSKPFFGVPGLVLAYPQNLSKAYDEAIATGLTHDEALAKAGDKTDMQGVFGVGMSFANERFALGDEQTFIMSKIFDKAADEGFKVELAKDLYKNSVYVAGLQGLDNDVAVARQYEFKDTDTLKEFLNRNNEQVKIDAQELEKLSQKQPDIEKRIGLQSGEVADAASKGAFVVVDKGRYVLAGRENGLHEQLKGLLSFANEGITQKRLEGMQQEALRAARLAAWQKKYDFLQANSDDYLFLAKAKSFGNSLWKNKEKKASDGDE